MSTKMEPHGVWLYVLQDRPDGVVEAQLYLHRLDNASFRSYTLVAENVVSTGAADVQLVRACSAACRSLRRT